MNLGDPELELIDPTPNVHALFVHFDKIFFWTSLASRAIVRWSKRMYSCAGICSYDRVGLCEIALSEPLLKLRPRKDLVETLLHEMIHAYLFITNRDRDRDGHGPNFQAHMHRINKSAGLNISIYHDFHDEVKLYQTHWWRCNGPCQHKKPYFGIVRRSTNRAPGPHDNWWQYHQRNCGGTFVKIKEPEQKINTKSKKQNGDITKYIQSDKKVTTTQNKTKPPLKESNTNTKPKSSSTSTLVIPKKNVIFNPTASKPTVQPFTGMGKILGSNKRQSITDITETVRNVWANKVLNMSSNINNNNKSPKTAIISYNSNKHKTGENLNAPPKKIIKIDDYFKKNVKSVLKDVYGQDFIITETKNSTKLKVTPMETDLVECPICKCKITSKEINRHLDECLNKDLIESISKEADNILPKLEPCNTPNLKAINNKIGGNKSDINDNIIYTPIDIYVNIKKETADNVSATERDKNKTVHDDINDKVKNECPCCGKTISIPIQEHLDECLAFFNDNETVPEASTSSVIDTIVLDDDDEFDETLTLNATGTKSPCPCCLQMIEQTDMNNHLDLCLI